ncbi:hypothetical protein AB0J63_20895 [Streptosporangium canum]|uniref:hypothetical protein n=1 Tax=Streptosporangium canum TaxID=324952 RepID=UPI0034410937
MRACLEPVYQASPGPQEAAARAAAQAPPRTQWPTIERWHAQLGDNTLRTARQADIVDAAITARRTEHRLNHAASGLVTRFLTAPLEQRLTKLRESIAAANRRS